MSKSFISLADCWQRTADMDVPQFRDGECEVRRLWDESVAIALGWDVVELSKLRHLLHREPLCEGTWVQSVRIIPSEILGMKPPLAGNYNSQLGFAIRFGAVRPN